MSGNNRGPPSDGNTSGSRGPMPTQMDIDSKEPVKDMQRTTGNLNVRQTQQTASGIGNMATRYPAAPGHMSSNRGRGQAWGRGRGGYGKRHWTTRHKTGQIHKKGSAASSTEVSAFEGVFTARRQGKETGEAVESAGLTDSTSGRQDMRQTDTLLADVKVETSDDQDVNGDSVMVMSPAEATKNKEQPVTNSGLQHHRMSINTGDHRAAASGFTGMSAPQTLPTNLVEYKEYDTCAVCDEKGHVARHCHLVDKDTGFLAGRQGTPDHGCAKCNGRYHSLDACPELADLDTDSAFLQRLQIQVRDRARRPPVKSKHSWVSVVKYVADRIHASESKQWRGIVLENIFLEPHLVPLTRAWCMERVKDMEKPVLHPFTYGWNHVSELEPDSRVPTEDHVRALYGELIVTENWIEMPEEPPLPPRPDGFASFEDRCEFEMASVRIRQSHNDEAKRIIDSCSDQLQLIRAQMVLSKSAAKAANAKTDSNKGNKQGSRQDANMQEMPATGGEASTASGRLASWGPARAFGGSGRWGAVGRPF